MYPPKCFHAQFIDHNHNLHFLKAESARILHQQLHEYYDTGPKHSKEYHQWRTRAPLHAVHLSHGRLLSQLRRLWPIEQ